MQTLVRSAASCVAGSDAVPAGIVPASAQDSYRQTVVVTAAATPWNSAAPHGPYGDLTRADCGPAGVLSVADVLRLLASVDVRARGERGVQTDFAIRGAELRADAGARRRRAAERRAVRAPQRRHPGAARRGRADRGAARSRARRCSAPTPSAAPSMSLRAAQASPGWPSTPAVSALAGGSGASPSRGGRAADCRRVVRAIERVHVRPRVQQRDACRQDLTRATAPA